MENPFNKLLQDVVNYFVEPPEDSLENYHRLSTLIRIHSEKLSQDGDVSYPGKPEIWLNYFLKTKRQLIDTAFEISSSNEETAEKSRKKFLAKAKEWIYPVEKVQVRQQRIHLYLSRCTIVENLIPEVLKCDKYGQLKKTENKNIYVNALVEDDCKDYMSFYRSKLVYRVLQNLLKYSRWSQVDKCGDGENVIELEVRSVASKSTQSKQGVVIKCGLVTDPLNSGKCCQILANDYLSIRSNDLTLLALHKYGIRVQQGARFTDLMKRLGSAAATVDLLEVKHTSPVQIIRNGQGSTKGASFILYNSARLETILRTFQERIDAGAYDPLPPIDTIQLHLLNEEEEWQLVYVYLAGFPNLIDRCMNQLELGLCSIHLIIHFLHGLVATFSVYYRRRKILMEKRDHLMPQVYARIYLIKAVREILNKTLSLLDIQPVDFM